MLTVYRVIQRERIEDPHAFMSAVLASLGHGKDGLRLRVDHGDTVSHGAVTVAQCNPIRLGVDAFTVRLEDGTLQQVLATADNVREGLEAQGHQLQAIENGIAYGDMIVSVRVTTDETNPDMDATPERPFAYRRADNAPDEAAVHSLLGRFFNPPADPPATPPRSIRRSRR